MARDPYKYFRIEARQLSDELGQGLLELERAGSGDEIVPRLLRLAHTLKGAARVVRLQAIADHAHAMEELLAPLRERSEPVATPAIEALLDLSDQVVAALAGLPSADAPAPTASGPAERPGPAVQAEPSAEPSLRPEPPAWVMAADVAEIDRLLEGIIETYAELNVLGDVSSRAAAAAALSGQLAEDLEIASRRSGQGGEEARRLLGRVEELSGFTGDVERRVGEAHRRVDREVRQLRDAVEQLRLAPSRALFPGCERAARDSAQALGKEIVFASAGGDIRLDGQVVRIVQDALQQLVRNAVAHGIEERGARAAAGKPAAGRVAVSVLRRGNRIVFRCEDDGRGIDLAALRAAAVRRGRPDFEPAQLNGAALARLLLQGGVSTSAVVSEVAGRGIGMDIVRDAVTRLGAEFVVASEAGKGTRFDLAVPQSLSSVEALTVEADGVRATVPLYAVREARRLAPDAIGHSMGGETIHYGGEVIPLVPLARLLGRKTAAAPGGSLSAVIVTAAGGRAALGVGHVHGSASVVFRPLPELAPSTPVVAGASLDADGRPLLMLDPDGIVAAAQHAAPAMEEAEAESRSLLVIDDSLTTRMLEQSILESAGYKVDLAISGEDGLERALAGDYALILVDVEMPGMDGFTFIETIRRDQKLRHTPAILVTSRDAPEDRRRGITVGAQDYVVKSEFDQTVLLDRIRQLIAPADA